MDERITCEELAKCMGYSLRYLKEKTLKHPMAPKPVARGIYLASDIEAFFDVLKSESKHRRYTEQEWIEIEANGRHSSVISTISKRAKIPAWADLKKIREIYKQAVIASKQTGIPHQVDHIIPLGGEVVTGLHVHENLQVITRRENIRKKNHYVP